MLLTQVPLLLTFSIPAGTFNTTKKLTLVITVNYTPDFNWISPVFLGLPSFVPGSNPGYHTASSHHVSLL